MQHQTRRGPAPFGLLILTLCLFSFGATALAGEPDGPRVLIEGRYAQIDEIIKSTPEEAAMREKIRASMDDFVDYPLFAKLAAKKFWDEMNDTQREEYVALFKQLIQRTYLKRFKANKPFQVQILGETEYNTKRTKAMVRSEITSGKISADVVYKLYRPEDRAGWWAYDVVIDEVSLMRNYRVSFNKTWARGGYELLSSKMRRKLERVEQPDTDDDEEVGTLD